MQILLLLLATISTLAAAGDIRKQCESQGMAFTGDEHNPSFSYVCSGPKGEDSSMISLNDCFAFNTDERKFEVKAGGNAFAETCEFNSIGTHATTSFSAICDGAKYAGDAVELDVNDEGTIFC
ncbi:hypothetical protein PHISCL_04642 [Aspergillus sclerotialis]|uniref:Cyanovirin-N domain-containing protein n=1 Tax=Aspergillus sclerotialis TaxID=2070753 RepID=A0A3A2ZNP9_9EURO|nr:hypothetical protein PHISCL_04642 [Aspergillus sclerotialis]